MQSQNEIKNGLSNTHHIILADITNTTSPTLLEDKTTTTGHEILREAARRNLQIYTDQMVNQMKKKRKQPNEYNVGDLVKIRVLKIDHSGVDRPTLLCKI